ncbi:MAG TPA: LacI family DNA-binding transcriptional regulator [Clostridia bacterium]|nr:LacI family DNA-binding transcriptional regulator [Clostridia bacterium]
MAVRMKDIAEELGVSLMTVSKALRNHLDVSEATRRRIRQRARELQYEPNLIARSLASRRTYLIGLIIPDMMHSFFAEVAKGIGRKLEPLGYQILISNSGENAEAELRQLKLLMARSVDGLIIASAAAAKGNPAEAALLNSRKTPYVCIDRPIRDLKANFVGVKDEEIGAMATEHLIEEGCRNIAHISGPMNTNGRGRLQGYRRTLAKHGLRVLPENVVSGAHEDSTGYGAMQKLMKLKRRPDGVVCYNDAVAIGAIKAILEAGFNVPRDIAVIGAGDVHYSDLLKVPLSTINQNSTGIGETAAEILLECMETKKARAPKCILFPPRLVVRESSMRKRR